MNKEKKPTTQTPQEKNPKDSNDLAKKLAQMNEKLDKLAKDIKTE